MTDERTGYARLSSAASSSVLALVVWGWFVWGGRIRNVNADPTLRGGDYWGPMLLSTSFVLMGAVVAVLLWQRRQHPRSERRAAALTVAVRVLAGWTTAVWVVRAGDIALGGDHPAGFIAVHVVLAAVSIGLSAWAVAMDRKVRSGEHTTALTASQQTMS
jgi:hypothetical protein